LFGGDKESRLVGLIGFLTKRGNFSSDPALTIHTSVFSSGTASEEAVCNRSSPVVGPPIGEAVIGAEPLGTMAGAVVVE
jgi:hypothetical protein